MAKLKKTKVAFIASIVAVVLSAVTTLGIIIGVKHNNQDTVEVKNSMYEIGLITETGKLAESKHSAYLEDISNIDGLVIDIDEDNATITYKVVFYDADEKFISMTEDLTEDYDVKNNPENAEFFRIMITPNEVDGEPVKLSIFNLSKYTKQIDVSFNK